jgi:hypothetical protein
MIGLVKTLDLCNERYHLGYCQIAPLAFKELARGHWLSLLNLTICNYIIMKGGLKHSEMKDAFIFR